MEEIEKKYLEDFKKAQDLKELFLAYKKYLGKKGIITLELKKLKDLPLEERKEKGKYLNWLKEKIEKDYQEFYQKLKGKEEKRLKEHIDFTAKLYPQRPGKIHPLSKTLEKCKEIFLSLGFEIAQGPEIETEFYNFDALNIPPEHPARDIWDTFWLKLKSNPKEGKYLLRTHTSPVQIRYLLTHQPPLKIISPGRCFRHEATDSTHEIQFYQLEGLVIEKKGEIRVSHFLGIIEAFFTKFFEKKMKVRLRPSYFPFTEPSFEVDLECQSCKQKGCKVCKHSGWIEMMGAGMVHPQVLKNAKLNPKNWQGFAFGLGIDRLTMLKYGVEDIRLFYSGDLRFLNQF